MKQHIGQGQIEEISREQRRTLEAKTDLVFSRAEHYTIGKMIEILCNSDFCFPRIGLTESKNRHEYIVVGVYSIGGSERLRGKCFEGDELCDALWEAVKSIL